MDNQLQLKNPERVPQELPRLKTGDEKYELAVSGNVISISPLERLKEVLRVVMLKLGIRGNNLPDEEEKAILLMHISEYYGRHTCEEIKLAFDLALEGKLNLEPNEVKSYENFSCLYFSMIMNAYRYWTTYPKMNLENKKRRLELPYYQRGKLSDSEMEEWIEEWCTTALEHNKRIEYVPTMFYDWLNGKGILNITDEQKKTYFEQSIAIKEKELYNDFVSDTYHQREYDKFIDEKKANEFNRLTKSDLQNLSEKIAVFNYLKSKK